MGGASVNQQAKNQQAKLLDTVCVDIASVLTPVNRRYSKDWDIYAGRPSILGNPYTHLTNTGVHSCYRVMCRDDAVQKYEEYAWRRMQMDTKFREALLACAGKRVACWCHPLNCHVHAIARLIVRWFETKGLDWREEHL